MKPNAEFQSESKPLLDYASPPKQRHIAWSVVGFGLAVLLMIPVAKISLKAFSAWLFPGAYFAIRVTGESYLIHTFPMCLCIMGLGRGRKELAIAGIAIAVVSLIATSIVVAGSPWR